MGEITFTSLRLVTLGGHDIRMRVSWTASMSRSLFLQASQEYSSELADLD